MGAQPGAMPAPGNGATPTLAQRQAQMDEAERTRFERPDIKAAFKGHFQGILSKREIAKLVLGSGGSSTPMMASWEETQAMLAADREAERQHELERLRRVTLPPDQRPGLRRLNHRE